MNPKGSGRGRLRGIEEEQAGRDETDTVKRLDLGNTICDLAFAGSRESRLMFGLCRKSCKQSIISLTTSHALLHLTPSEFEYMYILFAAFRS